MRTFRLPRRDTHRSPRRPPAVRETPHREYTTGPLSWLVRVVCIAFFGLYWYFAGWGYFSPESYITLYLALTFILVFLLYPASRKSPVWRPSWLDLVGIAATVFFTAHYTLTYSERFLKRWGEINDVDVVAGVIGILVSMEVCRRVIGWHLPVISTVLLAYGLFGHDLPWGIGHTALTVRDLLSWTYSSESLFGSLPQVFANYIFLFVVFGAMLEAAGGRKLFISLPLALLGRTAGGPGKVAVVASALFGTISGSATANVVSTGNLTIPMMKRAGFPAHFAGAIEATASSVGIVMPPLMGAAIFIMSDIIGVPYWDIAKVAIVPALLFSLSVFMIVDGYARKHKIVGLPPAELGEPRKIAREYWPFALPIVVVTAIMASGRSADAAVFWGIPSIVAASLIARGERPTPSQWIAIVVTGVRNTLAVGAIVGCLGIILGVVTKTGLAVSLSYLVVDWSFGSLFAAIALTAVATLALGLGVSSVTADYFLLSILVAPALVNLGATAIAAHLLIIWYTQTSNLTPPVCVSTFAAAAIAKSDPWKTGWTAFRIGLFIYVIPVMFVYGDLLSVSQPLAMLQSTALLALSALTFSGAIVGYLFGAVGAVGRIGLAVTTVLLIYPNWILDALGVAFLCGFLIFQLIRRRSQSRLAAGME